VWFSEFFIIEIYSCHRKRIGHYFPTKLIKRHTSLQPHAWMMGLCRKYSTVCTPYSMYSTRNPAQNWGQSCISESNLLALFLKFVRTCTCWNVTNSAGELYIKSLRQQTSVYGLANVQKGGHFSILGGTRPTGLFRRMLRRLNLLSRENRIDKIML
jgi:hypothetical protein